jgi:hypothetical protein
MIILKKLVLVGILTTLLLIGVVPLIMDSTFLRWEENHFKDLNQYNDTNNNLNNTITTKTNILERINNLSLSPL